MFLFLWALFTLRSIIENSLPAFLILRADGQGRALDILQSRSGQHDDGDLVLPQGGPHLQEAGESAGARRLREEPRARRGQPLRLEYLLVRDDDARAPVPLELLESEDAVARRVDRDGIRQGARGAELEG